MKSQNLFTSLALIAVALLPLACNGLPDAQYGVGYMYYYGLGVAQDTDVGYFWIRRAANARYLPAIKALELIDAGEK